MKRQGRTFSVLAACLSLLLCAGLHVTAQTPPARPTGVMATAGDGQVTLSWSDPDNSKISKYQYRQGTGTTVTWGSWTDITNSSATTTRHTVTGLTNGTAYSFEIRAVVETATFGTASATVTATPLLPVVSFESASRSADEGGGSVTVMLSVSPTPKSLFVGNYTVSGTATEGSDFLNIGRQFLVPAGVITVIRPIVITDDNEEENDETIILTLTDGTGYTVGNTNSHTITIMDNDKLVFSPTSLTVEEGNSGTYRVKLAIEPTGNVTVTVAGASGEVTVDTNSGSPGNQNTLSFTTSDWNMDKTVTVSAGQDDDTANDEATLSHSASGGGYGSVTGNLVVTVTDDDTPTPTGVTATAGDGQVTLSWSNPGDGNISKYQYHLRIGDTGNNWRGWTNISGSNANTVSHTVTGLTNSQIYTFVVRAFIGSRAGPESSYVFATPMAPPGVTINPTSLAVTEGGAVQSFTVVLNTNPGTGIVTVGFSSSDTDAIEFKNVNTGSSWSDAGFALFNDAFSWNSLQTIQVRGKEDSDIDSESVQITVNVSHTGNRSYNGITVPPMSVSVTDNDLPEVTIMAGASPLNEGTMASFTVSADPMPSSNLSVNLTVTDAPHANFASATGSPRVSSRTVNIPTSGSANYRFGIASDINDEPSGPVTVTVAPGTGYTVGTPSSASVTVNDNDPTRVMLTTPDAMATEGSSSDRATLRLTLNRPLRAGERLQVPLTFSGGTLDTDFTLSRSGSPTGVMLSGSTVTFNGSAGGSAMAADVLVSASQDADTDDETVTVSIPSGTTGMPQLTATGLGGGARGSRTGNGQIILTDDDTPPPAKPTGFTAMTGDEEVTLSWTDPKNSDITGYQFRQKEGSDSYGSWTDISSSGATTITHTVSGLNNGTTYTFQVRAVAGTTNGDSSDEVMATPRANSAPTVMRMIPDQSATVGTAFSYQVSENTFSDADNDPLTYAATRGDDSALPTWLSFDTNIRTFSGTPQAGDVGTLNVKVTANDSNGGSVFDAFDITVNARPVVTIAAGTSPVTEGTAAAFTVTAAPAPAADLTVNLSVAEAAGSDFVASGNEGMKTVMIPASGSVTYTVATVNDDTDEPNGSVTVTVVNGTGYAAGTPSEATVTVNDDDDDGRETPLGILIAEGISIYPNPASGHFILTGTSGRLSGISLISTAGKAVRYYSASKDGIYDTSGLSEGIFFVIIEGDEGRRQAGRIVIRK